MKHVWSQTNNTTAVSRYTCGEPDDVVGGVFGERDVPSQSHPVHLCLLRGLRDIATGEVKRSGGKKHCQKQRD